MQSKNSRRGAVLKMLKYSCFFLADMEIDGTLDESFLSVISEDAPMVPHWEIGTINNFNSGSTVVLLSFTKWAAV